MAFGFLGRLFGKGSGTRTGTGTDHYEKAREAAQSRHVNERRRLAGRKDTEPEILYYLAEDPDPDVRRAIAGNEAAPRHADLVLARDRDGAVRSSLAEKIAGLAPGLSADEQDRVRAMTYEVLEILARDQMVRVREILSETLKDVADAPPELIRRLAWDVELVVSGPVLERSPVLSDDDLIAIIKSGPLSSGALQAISRRQPVSEEVSDAIVAIDDVDAVTALLGNRSAQIREETLDQLVDRARTVRPWHEPLVNRPVLSPAAADRLAEFVADNLLDVLAQRRDLPVEVIGRVKTEVHRRLRKTAPSSQGGAAVPAPADLDAAMETAHALYQKSELTIAALSEATERGDVDFVMAALAVRAELPIGIVLKAVETESQKGIVALAWKAGFPVKVAVQLQRFLLRIGAGDVLGEVGDADYPLGEEEMAWQIEFFEDMV